MRFSWNFWGDYENIFETIIIIKKKMHIGFSKSACHCTWTNSSIGMFDGSKNLDQEAQETH